MKKSNYIKTLRLAMATSVIAFSCTASWAARDFTPQAGTWVISQELDGKPGRGLAIDVQGNTFFMQVFGYEKNGDATFYTATGQMQGNSVTAPLMRYQGGRSFGSLARDAVEDKTLGEVTVSFRNGLHGTVQFPGEPSAEIRRFLVNSATPGVTNPVLQIGGRSFTMLVLNEQGDVAHHWEAELTRSNDNAIELKLGQYDLGSTERAVKIFQQLRCEADGLRSRFTCLPDSATQLETGSQPRASHKVASLNFEAAGYDLSGVVQINNQAEAGNPSPPTSLRLTGFTQAAAQQDPGHWIGGTLWSTRTEQNYSPRLSFPLNPCMLLCYHTEVLNTLMPTNGTWIVEDELTGKPGRGMALDIQGDTAIMQVFNYRADGQPVFHMGSASYQSKGKDTFASVATIPMDEYAKGRSIGGTPQSAQWRAHAGDALLEITAHRIKGGDTDVGWITSGQVQLPGEQAMRVRRLKLEGYASVAEELLGQWYVPTALANFTLSRIEGKAAVSEDGLARCQPRDSGIGDNAIRCSVSNASGVLWSDHLDKPLMHRGNDMLRLRDRHGNAVGLGQLY